jgi:hypothetical protein
VIAVFVSEGNTCHVPQIEASPLGPPLDLARAEPGVDQKRHPL